MSLNDVDDDEMSVKSSLVCYQSINLLTPKDPKAAIIAVHIKQNRQKETYRKTEMWRNIKYRYKLIDNDKKYGWW